MNAWTLTGGGAAGGGGGGGKARVRGGREGAADPPAPC